MKLISYNLKYLIALIALFIGGIREGKAQLNFNYSLTGKIDQYTKLIIGAEAQNGSRATLTSGISDTDGNGWLRLTPMVAYQTG